jgi:hypothetical protein
MKKIFLTILFLFISVNAHAVYNFVEDANCMGAWEMTSSGSETDLSGNTETLTESTSDDMPTSTDTPNGQFRINYDTSRDFEDGDNEMLYHADGGSTEINGADQPLSICAWVNRESTTAEYVFVGKYSTGSNQRQYWISTHSSANGNVVRFILSSDGSATSIAIGVTAIDSGSWYHICGVYNDVDQRIYVNGILDSNDVLNPKAHTAGINGGTSEFGVGGRCEPTGNCFGANGFDGLISDPIIFDRALSADEVAQVWAHGIDGTKRKRIL